MDSSSDVSMELSEGIIETPFILVVFLGDLDGKIIEKLKYFEKFINASNVFLLLYLIINSGIIQILSNKASKYLTKPINCFFTSWY
jgi:hypothetical protein